MKSILTLIILFTFTLLLSCSSNSKNEEISKYKLAVITASNTYDFEIATKNLDSLKQVESENKNLLDSLNNYINHKKEFFNSFEGEYIYGGGSFESATGTFYYILNLNAEKKVIKLELRAFPKNIELAGDYKMEGDSILKVKWDKSNLKKDIGNIKIDGRLNTLQMIQFHIKPNSYITLKKKN